MNKKEIAVITKALVDAKKAARNCDTQAEVIQATAAVDCIAYDILPLLKDRDNAIAFAFAQAVGI